MCKILLIVMNCTQITHNCVKLCIKIGQYAKRDAHILVLPHDVPTWRGLGGIIHVLAANLTEEL